MELIPQNEAGWKEKLSEEEYRVLREKGTEAPFSGTYWNKHAKGMYHCRACGTELFSSEAKFDSKTGWPSFTDPVNQTYIRLNEDRSHGMVRTEVLCKKCGSHLGHLFSDGPAQSGGNRYCINSVCLAFTPEKK